MTDERLRELEQRWKASGSPEDEAAYLLERVRVGDLEKERLHAAAALGHEAACLASGQSLLIEDCPLQEHLAALLTYGNYAFVRALVAITRMIAQLDPPPAPALRPLCVVEAWCDGRANELAVRDSLQEWDRTSDSGAHFAKVYRLPAQATLAQEIGNSLVKKAAWHGSSAWIKLLNEQGVSDPKGEGDRRTTAAIRRELVPWLLGTGDAVSQRVLATGEHGG